MKRIGFALAAGFAALVAAPATAQDVVVTTPAPVVPVVTAGPVVESDVVTTKTRRGLFGRLRGRTTASSSVTMPAPAVVTAPVVAPLVPVAPAPAVVPAVPATMPAKPVPGTVSMTTTTTSVVPVSGVVVTEAPVVTTAGYTTMTESKSVTTTRRGLFGRLRNR